MRFAYFGLKNKSFNSMIGNTHGTRVVRVASSFPKVLRGYRNSLGTYFGPGLETLTKFIIFVHAVFLKFFENKEIFVKNDQNHFCRSCGDPQ